ncbi:hypothetical protein C6499_11185 [Candidatus Poribacteria bacterium]|nr:MAG: hypothetical protein C6499_11185 [Candidatus Poribacteria bacterium]
MGIKTDKVVFAVTGTTLLTFLIVSRIGTIWILYPNVLIAIFLLFYSLWQIDEDTSLLSNSAIFGCITVLTYAPMDWLFSWKAHLIAYRDPDFFGNVTTPIAIILNWMVFATLAAYCYQRLVAIFQTRFETESDAPKVGRIATAMLATVITGIGAAVGSIVIYGLGGVHLWLWNALRIDHIPQIASVPIFLPLAFLFTFLLCPYFFGVAGNFLRAQHAGLAGIRCGIFMGAFQFLSFLLFYVSK